MKKIITLTGASGAGKTTLCHHLLPELNAVELVSHTTRSPRAGEKEGVTYHFVSDKVFDTLAKIECTEYAGNRYCLAEEALSDIPDNGIGIIVVDQHGVDCLADYCAQHQGTYILLPIFLQIDEDCSRERMLSRGDNPESIQRRIQQQRDKHEYTPDHPERYNLILDSYNLADIPNNVKLIKALLHLEVALRCG